MLFGSEDSEVDGVSSGQINGELANLSEENANKVIYLMKDRYDMSRWGLINGITEVAQDFTLERRLELERMAGNLLVA